MEPQTSKCTAVNGYHKFVAAPSTYTVEVKGKKLNLKQGESYCVNCYRTEVEIKVLREEGK